MVWGLLLHVPNDPILQGVILNELWGIKREGAVCIEVTAAALVFRVGNNIDTLKMFLPNFDDELKQLIKISSTHSVVDLASVAAAAKNYRDEYAILSKIIHRKDFPRSLLNRYNVLTSRMKKLVM